MPDIVVLHWPAQAAEVAALARAGTPRLLLVAAEASPPVSADWREDWVRLPADERDIAARVLGLTGRAEPPDPPTMDGSDRLLFAGQWVALSPIESRIAAVLVEQVGSVVTAEELFDRGWERSQSDDHRPPSATALRVHLTRLRKRLSPLGLELRTVRSKGFVLQVRRA